MGRLTELTGQAALDTFTGSEGPVEVSLHTNRPATLRDYGAEMRAYWGTEPIVLAIVGSVRFEEPLALHMAAGIMDRVGSALSPERIVSGGAAGIDSLAEEWAKAHGYSEESGSLVIYRPTVRRWHGKGGFQERNFRILRACTHLLAIRCHTSQTYGSGWTADRAEREGRRVFRVTL